MANTLLEHVTRLADHLSPADKRSLIRYLETQIQGESDCAPAAAVARPQSLRGIWRDHFPPDPDIDAILHEIRHQWEEELTEQSQP
jgi:hypothetical protein